MGKNELALHVEVGPELLELKTLGDVLANIGLAGDRANLLDGTLTSLGMMIAEKAAHVGEVLGVL